MIILVAIILIVASLIILLVARGSTREVRYHNVVKPRMIAHGEASKVRRMTHATELVKAHWLPSINKTESKKKSLGRRANRAFARGNFAKAARLTARHDAYHNAENILRSSMRKEIDLIIPMSKSAKIDSKTGHVTGGVGRAGSKPSHRNPPLRNQRNSSGSPKSSWIKKKLIG